MVYHQQTKYFYLVFRKCSDSLLFNDKDNTALYKRGKGMQSQPVSIFERAFKKLVSGGFESVGRRGADIMNIAADLPDTDAAIVQEWIDDCLSENGGQVEARNQAALLGRAYLKLSQAGKIRFMGLLAERYGVNERSEEHTSELQSRPHLVCRLLLEKKKKKNHHTT